MNFKRLYLKIFLSLIFIYMSPLRSEEHTAQNLLLPVKTESPRDTMKSFLDAMNDYRTGLETGEPEKLARIEDAVRTLDLSEIPAVSRSLQGRESAVFLKEVIDRVILIDYSRIPGEDEVSDEPMIRWRLKNTEISINYTDSGERAGEYLFSADTVQRADQFYKKIKHLPYLEGSGMGARLSDPFPERILPYWAKKETVSLYVWQWIGLFAAVMAGLTVRAFIRIILILGHKAASRSRYHLDHTILENLKGPLDLLIASLLWLPAMKLLRIEGEAYTILITAVRVIISASLVWLSYRLVGIATDYLKVKSRSSETSLDQQLIPVLSKTIKVFTVIFGVLLSIQNLGINVMSLLAGLGIGGIAFALAAKDTVANFFGSIMIFFDRPFKMGDWVVVGAAEGTVEEIGFRSTRIRTFYNSLITIPNSDLMNARIDNMGARTYRRIRADLSLVYSTPPEKIEEFTAGVKEILLANPYIWKDNFHVVFSEYADSSLNVMLYCFLKVNNWAEELREKEKIYLDILKLAKRINVDFAFPTRTIYLEKGN